MEFDKLIYVFYFLLVFFLLWQSKIYKRKNWNTDFMSLSQTKCIQGFFAMCILFHHVGQKTSASWNPEQYIVHGLDFFVPIGFWFVSIFFFCSGYGLYKSYKEKANYLNNFIERRIRPLIVTFWSISLIFLLTRFITGEEINILQIINYAFGIELCTSNLWFVLVLIIFYLAFYFSFKFIKNDNISLVTTIFTVIIYTLLATIIINEAGWFEGEWWYNSVHLFSIGLLFAKFEAPIVSHIKKFYYLYLVLLVSTLLFLSPFSEYIKDKYSVYGKDYELLTLFTYKWINLLVEMAVSSCFVFITFIINMKIRIGNNLLKFMGGLTLEFYLIHQLYVEMFGYQFLKIIPNPLYIRNVSVYLLVVLVLSIISAVFLKWLHSIILKNIN